MLAVAALIGSSGNLRTPSIPIPSVKVYYGASGQYNTISSTRLTISTAQAKFGTHSLLATSTTGFSGRANAVAVPLSAGVSPPYTLEAWFYLTAGYITPPAYPEAFPVYLMAQNVDLSTTLPSDSIRIQVYGSYSLQANEQLTIGGTVVSPVASNTGTGISLNTWHHIAVAVSSSTSQMFWLDGVSTGASTTGAFAATMNYLVLNPFGTGQVAYYDDIRISSGDRYGAANSTITVPTSALTSDATTVALVNFE